MRPFPGPLPLVVAFLSTFVLGAILSLPTDVVHATDKASTAVPEPIPDTGKPWPRPNYSDASAAAPLDITDEAATLEAIHLALSELGDGASYVWHRRNGRISGVINPTTSFKDPRGRVCRHVVMTLTAGPHSSRTEGIACRMADKSWRLEG